MFILWSRGLTSEKLVVGALRQFLPYIYFGNLPESVECMPKPVLEILPLNKNGELWVQQRIVEESSLLEALLCHDLHRLPLLALLFPLNKQRTVNSVRAIDQRSKRVFFFQPSSLLFTSSTVVQPHQSGGFLSDIIKC